MPQFPTKADDTTRAGGGFVSPFTASLMPNADQAAWQFALGIVPTDPELAALAALTSATDKVPYYTGSGTAALSDLTPVARTLLAQTTQALMRSTGLGLGTLSTANASAVPALTMAGNLALAGNAITALLVTGPGTFVSDGIPGVGHALRLLNYSTVYNALEVGYNSDASVGVAISLYGSVTNGGAVQISTNYAASNGNIQIGPNSQEDTLTVTTAGNVGVDLPAAPSKFSALGDIASYALYDGANYERLRIIPGTSGSGVITIAAETLGTGVDDIDVAITPAGTGKIRFGTHSALASETVSGYITIKDSGGTLRKIAVVS